MPESSLQNENEKKSLLSTGIRSFATAFIILFLLMVAAYALTFILPAGEYQREVVNGQTMVLPGTYQAVEGGLPFWQWLLSPFLTLGDTGGFTMVAIIIFLLVISGTFGALENSGLLEYMLRKVAHTFANKRKLLLFLIPLLFMLMGSFIGSFEECIPMVPIVVSLSYALGWDALMGLGMSLLAVGFGFSTGVLNPFTVGIAQQIAGLPMFSGIGMRLISFVIIYALLMLFLTSYAKKIEKNPAASLVYGSDAYLRESKKEKFEPNAKKDKALLWFTIILLTGIAVILSSGLISALADLVLPITALMFLLIGLVCVPLSGIAFKQYGKWFFSGLTALAPAALLILMAGSIRYTLAHGHIMDTILHGAVQFIEGKPQFLAIIIIYALVLLLEFAISSGSAKAFLVMPLIVPVIDMVGISRQLSVLAFAYGDGFSNIFYPTNPALLVCLGITGISFGKWFKWTWKIQLVILFSTCLLLLAGLWLGY